MDGLYLIKADGTVKNLRRFIKGDRIGHRQLLEAVFTDVGVFDITYTKLFHEPGGAFASFKENTVTCLVANSLEAGVTLVRLLRIASHKHFPAKLTESP